MDLIKHKTIIKVHVITQISSKQNLNYDAETKSVPFHFKFLTKFLLESLSKS